MFSSMLAWTNCWTNIQVAGDLRCHGHSCEFIVIKLKDLKKKKKKNLNDLPPSRHWKILLKDGLCNIEILLLIFGIGKHQNHYQISM